MKHQAISVLVVALSIVVSALIFGCGNDEPTGTGQIQGNVESFENTVVLARLRAAVEGVTVYVEGPVSRSTTTDAIATAIGIESSNKFFAASSTGTVPVFDQNFSKTTDGVIMIVEQQLGARLFASVPAEREDTRVGQPLLQTAHYLGGVQIAAHLARAQ